MKTIIIAVAIFVGTTWMAYSSVDAMKWLLKEKSTKPLAKVFGLIFLGFFLVPSAVVCWQWAATS